MPIADDQGLPMPAAPDSDSLLLDLATGYGIPPTKLAHANTLSGGDGAPRWPPEELPEIPGFAIERELGRGGMGVVYLARQLQLDRLVALKVILDARFASPEQRLRFQFEAELAARVRHPNVVQVHEVGAHDAHPFIAYEYVDGGSLYSALGGRAAPPRDAASFVAQLADGVQAAHSQGIVHRDLKPANVLLSAANSQEPTATRNDGPSLLASGSLALGSATPKIADFGLAKRYEGESHLTGTGTVLGTPYYMAPEQARGDRQIGPGADVYALGAILYEMLSGRTPFLGQHALDVLLQAQVSSPDPVATHAPQTPRDLAAICGKCLERDPERRYGSAAELAADLRRFLEGRPTVARPAASWERLWLWRRRNPAVAALAAAFLLTLLGGLAATSAFAWRNAVLRTQAQEDARRAETLRAEAEGLRKQAQAEAKRAEDEAGRAKHAIDAMTTDQAFLTMGRLRIGWSAEQIAFLTSAIDYYRGLAALPAATPAERFSAADARRRLGFLLHRLYRLPEAVAAQTQAVAELKALRLEFSADPRYAEALAIALSSQGTVLHHSNDLPGALAVFFEAIALRHELMRQTPIPSGLAADLCDDLSRAARLQVDLGQPAEADKLRQEALALAERLVADQPKNDRPRELMLVLLGDHAFARSMSGPVAEADASFARGQILAEALLKLEHVSPDRLMEIARFHEQHASHRLGQHDAVGAERIARRGVEIAERLASLGPGLMATSFNLASAFEIHGRAKLELGQPLEARRLFERGLAVLASLKAAGADQAETVFRRMELRRKLATAHERLGDGEAAERLWREAMEELAAARAAAPTPGRHRPFLVMAFTDYAFMLRARGRLEEGRAALAEAVSLAKQLAREAPHEARTLEALGGALCNLAVFDRQLSRYAEAEKELDEAEAALLAGRQIDPKAETLRRFLLNTYVSRARLREAQERHDEAGEALGKAIALAAGQERIALSANQALCFARTGLLHDAVVQVRQCLREGSIDRQSMGCCVLVFAHAAAHEADDEVRGHLELGGVACLRVYLQADPADQALLADPAVQEGLGASAAFRDLLWQAADLPEKAPK